MFGILKFPLQFILMVSFIQFYPSIVSESVDNDEQTDEMPVFGDTLIVNGQQAKKGQYPWMIVLYIGKSICTASLVASNLVLTAAHCIMKGDSAETIDPSSFYGIVGNINRNGPDKRIKFERIAQPGFSIGARKSGKTDFATGDIAILWVTENVTFTDLIQPISLTSAGRNFGGETVTAMGWGRTPNKIPDNLMFAQLQVLKDKDCTSIIRGAAKKVICVSSKDTTATCFGDSGGPLVYQDPSGVPIVIGVTSFGIGRCGTTTKKTAYTAIADYNDWIIEQVGNNSGITFV